jgi:hypothetical protein
MEYKKTTSIVIESKQILDDLHQIAEYERTTQGHGNVSLEFDELYARMAWEYILDTYSDIVNIIRTEKLRNCKPVRLAMNDEMAHIHLKHGRLIAAFTFIDRAKIGADLPNSTMKGGRTYPE